MRAAAALLLACIGCREPDGECGPRTGEYEVTRQRLDGDCDEGSVSTVEMGWRTGLACRLALSSTDDSCATIVETSCITGPGEERATSGLLSWAPGGASGTGMVSEVVTYGRRRLVCSGTYAVTLRKL